MHMRNEVASSDDHVGAMRLSLELIHDLVACKDVGSVSKGLRGEQCSPLAKIEIRLPLC